MSGSYEQPDAGFFAIMDWLAGQEGYSASEMLWLQMGCTAAGLDGAYTDAYCHVLAQALFDDPVSFARALAADGVDGDTMDQAAGLAAYDARTDLARLEDAVDSLSAALEEGAFTAAEENRAELLLLRLTDPEA